MATTKKAKADTNGKTRVTETRSEGNDPINCSVHLALIFAQISHLYTTSFTSCFPLIGQYLKHIFAKVKLTPACEEDSCL